MPTQIDLDRDDVRPAAEANDTTAEPLDLRADWRELRRPEKLPSAEEMAFRAQLPYFFTVWSLNGPYSTEWCAVVRFRTLRAGRNPNGAGLLGTFDRYVWRGSKHNEHESTTDRIQRGKPFFVSNKYVLKTLDEGFDRVDADVEKYVRYVSEWIKIGEDEVRKRISDIEESKKSVEAHRKFNLRNEPLDLG